MNHIESLGANLKASRKQRFPKDTMKEFATRCGVSLATYQKMEKGDLSIGFKHYYEAAKLLGSTSALEELFKPEENLFDD